MSVLHAPRSLQDLKDEVDSITNGHPLWKKVCEGHLKAMQNSVKSKKNGAPVMLQSKMTPAGGNLLVNKKTVAADDVTLAFYDALAKLKLSDKDVKKTNIKDSVEKKEMDLGKSSGGIFGMFRKMNPFKKNSVGEEYTRQTNLPYRSATGGFTVAFMAWVVENWDMVTQFIAGLVRHNVPVSPDLVPTIPPVAPLIAPVINTNVRAGPVHPSQGGDGWFDKKQWFKGGKCKECKSSEEDCKCKRTHVPHGEGKSKAAARRRKAREARGQEGPAETCKDCAKAVEKHGMKKGDYCRCSWRKKGKDGKMHTEKCPECKIGKNGHCLPGECPGKDHPVKKKRRNKKTSKANISQANITDAPIQDVAPSLYQNATRDECRRLYNVAKFDTLSTIRTFDSLIAQHSTNDALAKICRDHMNKMDRTRMFADQPAPDIYASSNAEQSQKHEEKASRLLSSLLNHIEDHKATQRLAAEVSAEEEGPKDEQLMQDSSVSKQTASADAPVPHSVNF